MIECTFSFAQSIARFDRFSEPFRKRRKVSRVTSPFCGQIVSTDSFCTLTGLITYMANKRRTERGRCTKRRKKRGRKRAQLLAFDDLLLLRQDQGYRAGSAHACCSAHVSGLYLRTRTHTQRASGTGAITTTVFLAGLGDAGSIYRMTVSIFVPAGFHAEKKGEGERDGKSRKSPTISDEDDDNDERRKRRKRRRRRRRKRHSRLFLR